MRQRTLHSDPLRTLLDEADDETLDTILEVGASWEEISEIAQAAQQRDFAKTDERSSLVTRVQDLLFERRRDDE